MATARGGQARAVGLKAAGRLPGSIRLLQRGNELICCTKHAIATDGRLPDKHAAALARRASLLQGRVTDVLNIKVYGMTAKPFQIDPDD